MNNAMVAIDGDRHVATEADPVTFGRDTECTICLDPEDTGISRMAGAVCWRNGIWWLENRSRTRPLIVTDVHIPRNVLPQQRRHPLDVVTRVIVDGGRGEHILTVTPHSAADALHVDTPPDGLTTVSGLGVKLSPDDRLALSALFENYMHNPSRITNIRSYEAAALRLGNGHTSNQVRRRVENLRDRLYNAGIRQVKGANAMQHLAEYLIQSGQLSFADLRRLPSRPLA